MKTESEKREEQDKKTTGSGRFYSPLVMNIAREENISFEELESIQGSGENGRVQKKDILQYLENKKQGKTVQPVKQETPVATETKEKPKVSVSIGSADQIIEMDRCP
ncbi:MAG: E3 binding domain-containing protein [Mangrovibacterium sp.]